MISRRMAVESKPHCSCNYRIRWNDRSHASFSRHGKNTVDNTFTFIHHNMVEKENNRKIQQQKRKHIRMKKRSEETQTLHAGCSKAEPKIFAPWRWSLPLPTNPVWWGSMHAISSYRGNRPTNTPINRRDRLQYTAPQLSA